MTRSGPSAGSAVFVRPRTITQFACSTALVARITSACRATARTRSGYAEEFRCLFEVRDFGGRLLLG